MKENVWCSELGVFFSFLLSSMQNYNIACFYEYGEGVTLIFLVWDTRAIFLRISNNLFVRRVPTIDY